MIKMKWKLLVVAVLGVLAIIGCTPPEVDVTAPTVSSTVPAASATAILIDVAVSATFDEAMDAATITTDTFTLAAGATAVAGVVNYDVASMTATFTPTANLANATEYTATITVGALDVAGNALADPHSWTFTTGALADTTRPTVTSTVPADGAVDIAVNANITATFSEAMNAATIIGANFTVVGGSAVAGAVTLVGNTATFNPTSDLALGQLHTVTISTAVADSAGNTLLTAKVWTFTTVAPVAALGPDPVLLGSAGNYVILAETTVTNTTGSMVTGDIGLSPGLSAALTGFSLTAVGDHATSAQVVGNLYAADMTAPTPATLTTAVGDKLIAYNDAAGRASTDPELSPTEYFLDEFAGEIGGELLVPGLYEYTTSITIPANVTFSGSAIDTWIIQTPNDLTISANMDVLLAGGALPENIFWQVAGIVTIEAGAHFEGIILGGTQIILQTGASLTGRALATTQVTLDAVTVVGP